MVAIQEGPASQAHDPQLHVAAATKCQRQLSAIAEDNSIGARYCMVLEELRKELVSQSAQFQSGQKEGTLAEEARPVQTISPEISNPTLSVPEAQGNAMDVIEPAILDASPGSSLHDLSGWDAFDSIVRFRAPTIRAFQDFLSKTDNFFCFNFRSYQVLGTSNSLVKNRSLFECPIALHMLMK